MTPTRAVYSASEVHLSGILVVADADRLDACRRDLESLPGVEVHHTHRPSGRMIAVLESDTLAAQQMGLRRIQGLPAVRLAALVEHRIESNGGAEGEPSAEEGDQEN